MKPIFKILGVTTAILMASATAQATDGPKNSTEYKAKDNGGYEVESKSSMTDANGTAREGKSEVDVDVKDNGKVSKDSKSVKEADPKGLMNAKKDSHKAMMKQKDNGGYEAKTVDEHKDAAGTNTSTEVKTEADVKDDGSVEKTMEKTTTVDPKGLMNKTSKTVKIENGVEVK